MKETTKTRLKILGMFLAITCTIGFLLFTANRFKQAADNIGDIKQRSYVLASTYQAVNIYMQQNDARWPTSWDDLDGLKDPKKPQNPSFDSAFSQQWVTIDFSIDHEDIYNSTPENFAGIRPNGKVMDHFIDHQHQKLIDTVQRHRDEQR